MKRRLRSAGFYTIEQIKNTPNIELLKLRNLGYKTLSKIKGGELLIPEARMGNNAAYHCEICNKNISSDGTIRPKQNHFNNLHPEYKFYFKKVQTTDTLYHGHHFINHANYIE